MNSIYKIVFNKATQTFTAVSELAKGATKTQSQSAKQAGKFLPKFAKIALVISMVSIFSSQAMAVTDVEFNALKARLEKLEGINNKAYTAGSMALGTGTVAGVKGGDQEAVAMGYRAKATGNQSIALGFDAEATTSQAVALGSGKATGVGTIAIGSSYSTTSTDGTIKMTYEAPKATKMGAIALGAGNEALGQQSIVLGGNKNKAIGRAATAMGWRTIASGVQSTSSGDNTVAQGKSSTSMGYFSKAIGASSLATGGKLNQKLINLMSSKKYQEIVNDYADVFSDDEKNYLLDENEHNTAEKESKKTIFILNKVREVRGTQGGTAYTDGSIALGTGTVAGTGSVDDNGTPNDRTDDIYTKGTEEAVAMGYRAKAIKDKTLALGFDAVANNANLVALGQGAETKASDDIAGATVSGIQYGNFAGTPNGVVSIGKEGAEKQLVNVAAGAVTASSTDAINGSQLYSVADTLGTKITNLENVKTYVHVHGTGQVQKGNTTNLDAANGVGGAKGIGAIAIGMNAIAKGENAVAIGGGNKAEGLNSFASGSNTTASSDYSVVLGIDSVASGHAAVAIGHTASAIGESSLAMVNGTASGTEAVAIGKQTTASGISSFASGANTVSSGKYATAMGGGTKALADYATSLGAGTQAKGISSMATGSGSIANGDFSTAIGKSSKTYTQGSVALGLEAVAGVDGGDQEAVAVGYRSQAVANQSLALGFDAVANNENSVALGSKAETRAFTQVDKEVINGLKYKDFTGFADGVVSVGKTAHEKQIINVASGKISQESTDAINGSQLFATNTVLGNVAKSVKNNFGGNAAIDENGNITFTDVGGTGKGTIHEAIGDVKTAADAAKLRSLLNKIKLNNKADKNAG
ncbi:ESPR-type extended signal peptide-containing protein, partial [Pasteurella skyensis]